ncbi:MAG TPA: DUF4214 domain-containing protein [Pyrinomonadaceae bacterium]|nr:DUF4214 domain-containing protein [Pyrinomonadaceae bacterium]
MIECREKKVSQRFGLAAGLALVICAGLARSEQLPVKHYTTADGLGSSKVTHIFQDSRGFLWFSTRDGLSRFDGYGFVTYDTRHGLSAPTINYLTETRAGVYWVATNGGGVATPRCDYSTDLGVLRFAPGEKTRSFTVAIIDDSSADGMETTQLRLSDAVGVELGAQAQAQLTIEDNDAEGPSGANPVESPEGFVRQQYLDLLGREPEPEGERYWLGLMNDCRACDRAEVSARFFRSREFEERGYFVYRFYEAGLGRLPLLAEFMPDLAGVSGRLSEAELEASKTEFVESFASRPEFEDRYGALTDPAAYVDALLQTAGLPNHPGRAAWTEALANGTATRSGVLRALVESAEVYEKFYSRGFVAVQYFGHLRRDPDGSYPHWLEVMNESGGDTRAVLEGFLKSSEYCARFGKQ